MGWNSWNRFQCDVSEALIKETADAMVASGMRDAGYQYVVIDDCWQVARDARGRLVADSARFPGGIKPLADYVHSRGLKFGIYTDAGRRTCQGRPGTYGSEEIDARTFAEWGVDYVKEDWCYAEGLDAPAQYARFRDALAKSGRPIVLSICEWGSFNPWDWGPATGNLWRTTTDIEDTWASMLSNLDISGQHAAAARPGAWNDPDMLEVGNGMKVNEERAHFTMWSMLAAPLIAGNDIAHMSPETKAILTNAEVIAIDQDSLGVQGLQYSARDSVEVWFKPLVNGAWAMTVLNRRATPQRVTFDWKKEEVSDSLSGRATHFATTTYRLRDLWAHKDVGTTSKALNAEVPGKDVLTLRLTPKK